MQNIICGICSLLLTGYFSIAETWAQTEHFRRDYEYLTIYRNGQWSDSETGYNSFVFNVGPRNDIVHYMANGKKAVYRKLSDIYQDTTTDGEGYQMLRVLNDDGDEILLQLFDAHRLGLKLIISQNFMVQFHN
ncbi:MAG: hypothetical protein HC913_20660 [Microscillaceae bacterium]|nr:hypothetical protein [Microscillaceae bacterium]